VAGSFGFCCMVAPSPELQERLKAEIERSRTSLRRGAPGIVSTLLQVRHTDRPGLNDGLIIPGNYYPAGTPLGIVRSAAADRSPLRGTVRVIVVLVDFSDQVMAQTTAQINDLFFSTGVLPHGSVKEYYREVTNNLIDITGQVVGPYRMPRTMAEYAHGESGMGATSPNARTLAQDAVQAADAAVNFGPYDNDGNGFVDAFIVVHAGPGAEVTGSTNQIWSHKWVLEGGEYTTDGTRVYGYLTVPEDSRIGVCCHELGHLLFGWPDLYDTDYSSAGIGDWCLMAGGSWNGGGEVPSHPSAWCKANQGWVSVINQTTNQMVSIADAKDAFAIYRLWQNGAPGTEYFLVENRQRSRYDAQLPGDGLLIWHIDEAISSNSDEAHPKVALVQADGARQLESGANRGDGADPFPGTAGNTSFTNSSTPNSQSYAHVNTCVSVTAISGSAPVISAQLAVRCVVRPPVGKPLKDAKDRIKERLTEFGFGRRGAPGQSAPFDQPSLEARVAALEARLAGAEPFIGAELRPDLAYGALAGEDDADQIQQQMASGDAAAKRLYDSKHGEGSTGQ
jgi:immune inhibitor A